MKFISIEEYLMNRGSLETLSSEIVANINTLIPKINDLLERFGEKRDVSSGLRRMEDHLRIYAEINSKRKSQGLEPVKVPMGSSHLTGQAIDLEDKNDKLKNWCVNNISVLEELNLFMEHPSYTDTWCHLQIKPTKSRIFKPY
jgi:hypothetical protein